MTQSHLGELKLRRVFARELAGDDAAHAHACPTCKAKLKAIEDEQKRFQAEIPFERFAAGVQRAARSAKAAPSRQKWVAPLLALAASLLVVMGVKVAPVVEADLSSRATNRIKGSASIEVRIGSVTNGPQREAAANAPEALGPGERVRIRYQAGPYRYLTTLAIDDLGVVTPLYPEAGKSLPVQGKGELPDSVEFTGKGHERLIVVLSDEPFDVDEMARKAREAFTRAGGLTNMGPLEVPGEQFHRTFLKP